MLLSMWYFYSYVIATLILASLILKCAKKRPSAKSKSKESGPVIYSEVGETTNPPEETGIELTEEQKAQIQAEMDAAIEAEKKAQEKAKSGSREDVHPTAPLGPNDLEGPPPISLKKPISEGRTQVKVVQPEIWNVSAEPADPKKDAKPQDARASKPAKPQKNSPFASFSKRILLKRKAKTK